MFSLIYCLKPEGVQQQYSTSMFVQLSSSVPIYNNTMNVSLPPVGKLVSGSQYIEMTTMGEQLCRHSEPLLRGSYLYFKAQGNTR